MSDIIERLELNRGILRIQSKNYESFFNSKNYPDPNPDTIFWQKLTLPHKPWKTEVLFKLSFKIQFRKWYFFTKLLFHSKFLISQCQKECTTNLYLQIVKVNSFILDLLRIFSFLPNPHKTFKNFSYFQKLSRDFWEILILFYLEEIFNLKQTF